MRSARTNPFLLLAILSGTAAAQSVTSSGTTLTIDAGTSLRVDAPLTWTIASGASVVNDGTIVLGPGTTLEEAVGAPLTGAGTERTTRTFAGPLNAEAPGGLGLAITTDVPLGNTTVERGHLARMDTSGAVSIERWYDVSPTNNSGLNATLRFGYDATELNGISELEQVVHIATAGDSVWVPLSSVVVSAAYRVDAGPVDSLGRFTTFENALPMSIGTVAEGDGAFLAPTLATDHIVLYMPEGVPVQRIQVVGPDGRIVLNIAGPVRAQSGLPITIDGLAAGRYLLRLNDRITLGFVKQ